MSLAKSNHKPCIFGFITALKLPKFCKIKIASILFILLLEDTATAQVKNEASHLDTLNPFYTTIAYRKACNYALKHDMDSCLFFINLYLNSIHPKVGIINILSSPELNSFTNDSRWLILRDSLAKKLRPYYGGEFSLPLFLKLLQYQAEDQNARWTVLSPRIKNANNDYFVDTLNLKHLKFVDSLLLRHVALSKKTIGTDGMEAIFLFIQHCQDTVRQRKYAGLIKTWFDSGDLPGESYALYLDRIRINQNQPQIYGTQFWRDEKANQLVLYPIENIADLNKLRKQMGMKSIQYYLLNVEFLEKKKFRRESVAGLLKGNENMQDYISKEMQD